MATVLFLAFGVALYALGLALTLRLVLAGLAIPTAVVGMNVSSVAPCPSHSYRAVRNCLSAPSPGAGDHVRR